MTQRPTLEDFRRMDRRAKFTQMIGAELTACADGRAEVTLPWKEDLGQHNGFLHGALVGFLADYACAWAAGSIAGDVVTASYTLNILAPGIGERFVGRGHVVKASKRQITCRADVFAVRESEEKLIAIANAVIMRLEG
jgi:uncharacterized protein (TIGR00369 family)